MNNNFAVAIDPYNPYYGSTTATTTNVYWTTATNGYPVAVAPAPEPEVEERNDNDPLAWLRAEVDAYLWEPLAA